MWQDFSGNLQSLCNQSVIMNAEWALYWTLWNCMSYFVFSCYISISLLENREYLMSGVASDSVYQEMLALYISMCQPLKCSFLSGKLWK